MVTYCYADEGGGGGGRRDNSLMFAGLGVTQLTGSRRMLAHAGWSTANQPAAADAEL